VVKDTNITISYHGL